MENRLLARVEVGRKSRELRDAAVYPYYYDVSSKGQYILVVGVKHFFNPNDPQKKKILERWNEFLRKTEGYDRLVVVEGRVRPVLGSEEDAIRAEGEPGYITYLAAREGIETCSPEPDRRYEVTMLHKQFSKDEIIYYYFARLAAQWHRAKPEKDFDEYMHWFFRNYPNMTGWEDFDFTLEHMKKIHDQTHDHKFNTADVQCFNNDSNPYISKIALASSDVRDNYIIQEIKNKRQEGKSMFILYGSDHAISFEPALKSPLA